MRISAVGMGVAVGLAAALVQTVFRYAPPSAYGICVVCHGRDLANSAANAVLGLSLPVAQVSQLFPALTTIGILLAALVAAVLHGEFRWRRGPSALGAFAFGFTVMIFGLLAAACPLRLFLRTAYGDLVALAGIPALLIGIYLGNVLLSWGVSE